MSWHLAQLNIGRLRAPVDDPATADFMDNLDPINALAEATPGFIWRLQTEDGNATAIKAFPGDDLMILNMGVGIDRDAGRLRLPLGPHAVPAPEAFTFRHPFPHPGGPTIPADERNTCPV